MNKLNQTYKITINPKKTGYDHVFLKAEHQGGDSDRKYVVFVDADKFIKICKSTKSHLNDVNPFFKWSEHNKKETIDIYNPKNKSKGVNSLPKVDYVKMVSVNFFYIYKKQLPLFSFSDGRHRTLFLYSNGAKLIPMQCDERTAKFLQDFVT